MKKLRNIAIVFLFVIILLIIVTFGFYNYNLSPVNKNDNTKIQVEIPNGSSVRNIGEILEDKKLVRSSKFFYLYCKIYKINDMKATTYTLSKDMSFKEIVNTLVEGNTINPDEISITFNEGINMRKIADIIAKNTNNTEKDVFDLISDSSYLDELIKEYWFLTDDIKNPKLYYSLEGYLYPETYRFKNKDVTVKEILKKMLDQSDKIFSKYRKDMLKNSYSIHELLTLSSIVELEGVKSSDRGGIASVFLNRLKSGWSLGSDATTYYAARVDMNERDLKTEELNDVNDYNTRSSSMAGKLPIGPIANFNEDTLKTVLYPIATDYYYFVADKYGNVYFTKTLEEHNAKINELKSEGAWIEW